MITFGEAAVLGVRSTVVVPVTVELLTVLLSAPYDDVINILVNKNITSEIINFTFFYSLVIEESTTSVV